MGSRGLLRSSIQKLVETVNIDSFKSGEMVETNIWYYDNLVQTQNSLNAVLSGLGDNITGDFLALDIRHALRFLGEITVEITKDDLLANIFSKFCTGK